MKIACLISLFFTVTMTLSAQNIKGSIFGKFSSPLAAVSKDLYKNSYDSLQKKMPLDNLFKVRNNSLCRTFSFKALPPARPGDHIFIPLPLAKEGDHKFELLPLYGWEGIRRVDK